MRRISSARRSENKEGSDATFKAAVEEFTERGVDGVTGNYTLLVMVLNVSRVALPDGTPPLPALK